MLCKPLMPHISLFGAGGSLNEQNPCSVSIWSSITDSNCHQMLGRHLCYHYTNTAYVWSGIRDLNSYALRHVGLNHASMPIRVIPDMYLRKWIISAFGPAGRTRTGTVLLPRDFLTTLCCHSLNNQWLIDGLVTSFNPILQDLLSEHH